MQHDLDYDRAWDKVSRRFWDRRRRELAMHIALFTGAQLAMLFEIIDRGTMIYTNNAPLTFLHNMGLDQLPWITVNWTLFLALHMILLLGVGLGERIFRYSVERELLRDFAQVNRMDEKRKMRPSYAALSEDDETFDLIDEAQEVPSRQSAR
jgi:hypothetical protein